MDLNLLETFKKVAEAGSLTKAAKFLGHPKSKISRDLSKLENDLEMNLLTRSPKGIALTEKGLELLKSIRAPLENLKAAAKSLKTAADTMKGSIKLTAPEDLSSHFLAQLIFDFMDLFPKIKIDLISTDSYLDFQKHQIDLALRVGKLKDSALIQRKIADIEVIFVATSPFLKGRNPIKEVRDLKNEPVAIVKNLFGKPLNKKFSSLIDPYFSSNSIPLVKEFAIQSKGIATLPKFLCSEELSRKEFVQVLPHDRYAERGLYLLTPPAKFIPEHVKTFKTYIYDNLQRKLN